MRPAAGLRRNARFLMSLMSTPRLPGRSRLRAGPLRAPWPPRPDRRAQGLVVELGPGTGPVTSALLDRGLDRRRLVMVEYDPDFCRVLEDRFAGAQVIQGDAYELPRTLAESRGRAGLRLRLQPAAPHPAASRAREADPRRLRADGPRGRVRSVHLRPYVAYSARDLRGRYSAHRGRPIWANLPPARVWTYRLETPAHAAPSRRRREDRA